MPRIAAPAETPTKEPRPQIKPSPTWTPKRDTPRRPWRNPRPGTKPAPKAKRKRRGMAESREPEAEQRLLSAVAAISDQHEAKRTMTRVVQYANENGIREWPELESILLGFKDALKPMLCYHYAKSILRSQWPAIDSMMAGTRLEPLYKALPRV